MYKVLLDGTSMCDSRIEELALINPFVELVENQAGSFTFKIPPEHPMYNAIQRRKSVIQVVKNNELLFSGICVEETEDFFKQKEVYCEGEFTYFNDSIQRPARYKNYTVLQLLEAFVACHNGQVEEQKRFQVGIVTVEGIYDAYCYTNMETTMACFKADLINVFGGFFRVRYQDGIKYLDYLKESQNVNSQVIRLGKNLLDYTSNIDSTDIATAIIPLGDPWASSPVKGIDVKRTIESVNDGVDYLFNQDAVNTFGWIFKKVEFPDIRKASTLKQKGEEYLADLQFDNVFIEAKAIDLSNVDSSVESFKLSDSVKVISEAHGMNRYFHVTEQRINLNNPEKDTITLGRSDRLGLSSQTSSAINKNQITTTEQIATAMGGFVYKSNEEILIMDTDDIDTATKVWKWDLNGLSYSGNGYYGDYTVAITMDGKIAGKFLEADSVSADKVILEGLSTKNGLFQILENGSAKMTGADVSGKITAEELIVEELTCGEFFKIYSDFWVANVFKLMCNGNATGDALGPVSIDTDATYVYFDGAPVEILDDLRVTGTLYTASGTVSKSDMAVKYAESDLDQDKSSEFIYSLKPRQYKYKDGTSDRFHHGFFAQEVKECMGDEDWGVYIDSNPEEEGNKALRYEEIIADLVATVQSQNKRIKALEEKAGGTNE
jgi:phage minor structural protein